MAGFNFARILPMQHAESHTTTTASPMKDDVQEENDDTVFDHTFEGWSVWIELHDSETWRRHAAVLQDLDLVDPKSPEQFVPHLTLLYNFKPLETDKNDPEEQAWKLLESCIGNFQRQHEELPLIGSQWYAFDYPKSADNGKGFGASIAMMIFEKSKALLDLHSIVQEHFPKDERVDNYHPHASLVYAPLAYGPVFKKYVEQLQNQRVLLPPDGTSVLRAKSLSVWNTQGKIHDWKRVAQVLF